MRQFQVCENSQGLSTWSVAEIVDGRCVLIGDVNQWTSQLAPVISASKIGIITIRASSIMLKDGCAAFV